MGTYVSKSASSNRAMKRVRRGVGLLMAGVVVSGLLSGVGAVTQAEPAAALAGSEFDPGYIISDANFYDSHAMSSSEIQSFLDARIGSCPGGRCLNVAVVPVPDRARQVSSSTGNVVCEAMTGGNLRASELIYRVQVACGISAKVILVTLQKEQALVTSRAPSDWALNHAMGMACPDTSPCDSTFAGLGTQIVAGTVQLKTYKAARFAKQPGVQYIDYNPTPACGGTTLNVRNYATAALYSYTPYQPNAAALSNLRGSGDTCSAYGNRNFWVFYNDWFGSPTGTPRAATNVAPLVAARNAANEMLLYVGDGRGGWAAARVAASGWGNARLMAVGGDIDNDGNRDVLVVNASGQLVLFPTDGYMAVGDGVVLTTGWSDIKHLILPGDVTGDSRDDVVVVRNSGQMFLYPVTGKGTLGAARPIEGDFASAVRVFDAGDFDGDRRADIMSVGAGGELWLHRGDGRSGFAPRVQIGTGWQTMDFVGGVRDFDGDGAADLLARTSANGDLWLYRGDNRGGWRNGFVVGTGWNGMTAMATSGTPSSLVGSSQVGVGFADVNRDGRRDLLAIQGSTMWNYHGLAGGNLGPRSEIGGDWSSTTQLFNAGDFDADGYRDVMSIDAAGVLRLHPVQEDQLGAGRQIGQGWDQMRSVFSTGDFTGDRITDLLAIDRRGDLWLYAGPSLNVVKIGTGFDAPTAVFGAGDFDGDGASDVMVRYANGDMFNYRGNGAGSWASTFTQVGTGWSMFDRLFSPGDFDGDGRSDVMARKPNGDLWLYPGNGSGGWDTYRQVGSGWDVMSFIG